jgi:hypothetical protein
VLSMTELHEFITFEFKPGPDLAEQGEAMRKAGPALAALPGFKRRDYYYSETDQRWLAQVVWESEDLLDQSAPDFEEDPTVVGLNEQIETSTMRYSRYRMIGTESVGESPGSD